MRYLKASLDRYSFGSVFEAFFLLSQTLSWAAGPKCFDLKGRYLRGNGPCNPSAAQSVCCGYGWECLDNGICRSNDRSPDIEPNVYWQGTCTDPTWEASECNHACNGRYTPCGGTTFCCGDCDCSSAVIVDIPGSVEAIGTILTIRDSAPTSSTAVGSPVEPPSSTLVVSPVAPTTSTVIASPVAPTSSALVASSVAPITSTVIASPVAPLISNRVASPVATPTDVPLSNSNNALKIGLGVSLSLAGMLLLCAVWYIFKREHQWQGRVKELQSVFRPRQMAEIPTAQFSAMSWDRAPQELSSPVPNPRIQELDPRNGKTLRQELDTSNGMDWMQELDTSNGMIWMQELDSQNKRTVTGRTPTDVY